LVVGGLPAVRRALAAGRERPAGEPLNTSNNSAIIAVAEHMAPAIKDALWLDRAEAAVETLDHLSLRDLRATVVGATPRDEHGRDLDRKLREALDQRVTKLRDTWAADMTRALEDNRVLQALRLSSRPPEPSARFPAALVTTLAEAAGSAMTSETPPERWTSLLEAAVTSPIRRSIKPQGIPAGADAAVLELARASAGQVPALAGLLGMTMPPPPRPAPGARRLPPPPRPSHPGRRPPPPAGTVGSGSPAPTAAVAVEPAPLSPAESTADDDRQSIVPVEPETDESVVASEPQPEEPAAAGPGDQLGGADQDGGSDEVSADDDPVIGEEPRESVNQL
jgi:hypothetical protein